MGWRGLSGDDGHGVVAGGACSSFCARGEWEWEGGIDPGGGSVGDGGGLLIG